MHVQRYVAQGCLDLSLESLEDFLFIDKAFCGQISFIIGIKVNPAIIRVWPTSPVSNTATDGFPAKIF